MDSLEYSRRALGEPKPKICLNCGRKNHSNAKICENCGLHLD